MTPPSPHVYYDLHVIREQLNSGAMYLDVRSQQEFEQGHVPGALNVPWAHGSLEGLKPNPDFERELLERVSKQRPVVVGCRSGQRAQQAAEVLLRHGYSVSIDGLGWEGTRDAFGRLTPGWSRVTDQT